MAHTPLLEMEIDPILPDYVYDAMRLHKRFDLFHLGHQEDAEEFMQTGERHAKRLFSGFKDFAFSGNILEIAFGLM